jgi:vitamin B12 transporter
MSFLFIAALAAHGALAAPAAKPQPEIVVTATRRAESVDDTLASVDVLTRADIERLQATDLLELLRTVPGLDVVRTGGPGQTISVFMRGSNSNHVLVLIDGVRVASSNTGSFAFEHVPLVEIERIEIVRGPRASWYGSDAIGGVIQIFTRERRGFAARAGAGRYGRRALAGAYGGGDAAAGFGLGVGHERIDGFSAQTPDGFAFDPDDDGYDRRHFAADAHAALGSQVLRFDLLGSRAEVEFDQGESNVDSDAAALALGGPLASGWSHQLRLGAAREDLDTPAFFAAFDSRRATLDWVNEIDLAPAHTLVAGINWQRERGVTRDTFSERIVYRESRRNLAAFGNWRADFGPLDFDLAARRDDNSAFGGATTAQGAVGRELGTQWRGFASFGEGFRAPNLNELYSPGFDGLFAGNPELEPERSRSFELGLDGRAGAIDLRARAFRTRIDELIAFEGGNTFRAINIDRARIDGVEFDARRSIGALELAVNATWQDAENARSGRELLRRPRRKFGFELDGAEYGAWRFGTSASQVSERRDLGGPLGSYALFDLRAERDFGPHWRLAIKLENAGDRDYALARGFAVAGRSVLVSLDYRESP